MHVLEGTLPWPLPTVMGHESAGVVEDVGEDVTYVVPGDRVVACQGFCGACAMCLAGRTYLCMNRAVQRREAGAAPRVTDSEGRPVTQFADLATFAEVMLVHESAVVKMPDGVPFAQASIVSCGVMTGAGAVINTARVRPGETVAVIGCGGIGLNAIQAAALTGAARVVAVDRLPGKLELARKFGATDVVDASAIDAIEAVRELTQGGVDHAFEAVGLKSTVEQAWAMLAPAGTATVIGALPIGTVLEIPSPGLMAERRIQGCFMGSGRYRTDMPMFFDLYLPGRLRLDELVSAEIALDDVNEGYQRLRQGDVARSVITFSS
jgi:S-(hydroxymethyl)glutathione dehydrogenase / alcohol dehydrogenase